MMPPDSVLTVLQLLFCAYYTIFAVISVGALKNVTKMGAFIREPICQLYTKTLGNKVSYIFFSVFEAH